MPRISRRPKFSQRAEEIVVELPAVNRIRRRGSEGTRMLVRRTTTRARSRERRVILRPILREGFSFTITFMMTKKVRSWVYPKT
jgi:hypothetical protein